MRLMLVLLIMLNVAYATREALSKRSDVLKVAIAESGRRSAGSAKLLLLASEAWEAGRVGEMDIGAFAAHQEPVRDAAHMALGQQALATQLRLLYSEADSLSVQDHLGGVPLSLHTAGQADDESVQPFARRCIKVGPFADGAHAERALLELQSHVSEAFARSEDLDGRSVFWVHVPPRSTRADAKMVVRSLGKRGIASFVIADEGPLRNGVSLGVYHDAESASRSARQLSAIGYPVKVFRSTRTRTVHYIHASVSDSVDAGLPVALVELVRQGEPPVILVDEPCSGVAVQ